MSDKDRELINNESINVLESEDLVHKLEQAKLETIKYVNKFLEVEEKWTFINHLLKELNSVREKQLLCSQICDGFLKLTNSKICLCMLFNLDKNEVEFKKISFRTKDYDKQGVYKYIEKTNNDCYNLIERGADTSDILDYFDSISSMKIIAAPLIYNNNLLGYLALNKENENFYKENVHFVKIITEHVSLILENISLYEESEKRNKSKIEFLAGISHEFKTPLNSIIGFSDILKSENKNVEHSKYINNISQSSKHLLALIEDVLDVSKSQYKTLELNYTEFRPKDEILQVLSVLEGMFKEKNIELTYTLTDLDISADLKRFRQLIYNLVSNATKFNKLGGKINIFTYIKDENFFFEITDTGDGISKKDYEKIFDFFSQVNRNQLKRQLGSGVGLAICKRITDAHQGQISFKSQIKKGSCFWFNLPIKQLP